MFINFWYVAEQSEKLTKKPIRRKMLGQHFVLFRDESGKARCLSDVCIHRGGSLSAGKIANNCIQCPYHGWHFDESLVTTTIILQKPLEGGEFQYVTDLRGEDWDDYESLDNVLSGNEDRIQTLPVEAGTLLLFAGYYQLHRVTPVVGNTTRYVATLCFKDEPGVCSSPEVQKLFYGRTAAV